MVSAKSIAVSCLAAAWLATGGVARAADQPSFIEGGVLKVCTAGDFPPMQFYKTPGDKDLVGYEVDVIDALAKQWNARTEYVVSDFKGLLPSLDAQRCGLVASGILIRPERLQRYDGIPHFKTSIVLVTPTQSDVRSPDDLSGQTVAIEEGAAGYAKIMNDLNAKFAAEKKPGMVVQVYPGSSPIIEQLLVGRAAATVTQDTTVAFRSTQVPGRLKVQYTYPGAETFGFNIRKNPGDLAKLKETFAAVKASGVVKALLAKWDLPADAADVSDKAN